jgi:hypothetical protein
MTNPNDSAYPNVVTTDTIGTIEGFSKKEEALLRFMCAIIKGYLLPNEIPKIVETATQLTEAYFNELNREK